MPVICAACHTENRDAAMFCHGCARKLPAFAPTAPSVLETMRARDAAASARPSSQAASMLRRAVREPLFPLGVALLVAALAVAWYVQASRSSHKAARVASTAPATVVASSAVATVKADPPRPANQAPADSVPLVASLSPGELELAPTHPRPTAEPPAAVAPPTPAPPVASTAPAAPSYQPAPERRSPPRTAAPQRPVALDPRHGCETLNFVFAARCEAAHCDKPEYSRHPRCNLVREERKRDEARRNPTLGF